MEKLNPVKREFIALTHNLIDLKVSTKLIAMRAMPQGPKLAVIIFGAFLVVYFTSHSLFPSYTYSLDGLRPNSVNTPTTNTPTNNYAFSLFLAAPSMETKSDDDDLYFVGTRMIIYQLLHDPKTRTNNSYPMIVLVTEDVGKLRARKL